MTTDAAMVVEAAERLFADLADPQAILHAGVDRDWRTPLWRALEEMGLPRAWVPESLGGHGLTLADGFGVARAAGRAALAVPLVETMVAGWVAGRAGLALPEGAATLIVDGTHARVALDDDGRLRVNATGVPFARDCASVVVVAGSATEGARVAVVPIADCRIDEDVSLARDPSDGVTVDTRVERWVQTSGLSVDDALHLAVTCRALQIAGALQAALDLCVAYSMERVAFEKPIAKFQAVQQNLARLAGEVAAAVAVSESAADTLAQTHASPAERLLEVAAAKVRCGEAAETGTGIAHQVMGAIGYTEEHVMHRYTLRVLSWRDDFGSEMVWARRLGEMIGQRDSQALWQLLASR